MHPPPYQRILVTGAAGQLGNELTQQLGSVAIPVTRHDLDLTDTRKLRRVLLEAKPDLVINAAAYTAVDHAESEPDLCFAVNAEAVEYLAKICQQLVCPLVQISTDYVFGGDTKRQTPYDVECQPKPINVYGQSKLAGEQAAATWKKHLIVRTCGLYSAPPSVPQRGRNFADTMLILARERDSLQVVDDQVCTPTYVPHFVDMLQAIVYEGRYGIFHATNQGATTWFNFAVELFRQAGIKIEVTPIASSEYTTEAARPTYSALHQSSPVDSPRIWHSWQSGLAKYLGC